MYDKRYTIPGTRNFRKRLLPDPSKIELIKKLKLRFTKKN